MKVHDRYFLVRNAHLDLSNAVLKIIEEHKLTYHEVIRILLEEATIWNVQGLRRERHPNDLDKKADEA